MVNEQQFKLATRIVATRDVKEYRATIPVVVNETDTVLELGCEWGTTTELLAKYAGSVTGTDISPRCIQRAQKMRPLLTFRVLDAFDVMASAELVPSCSKLYADLSGLSGYRGLLDLIALLDTYAAVLRPGVIVVKSGALRHFAQRCTVGYDEVERGSRPRIVDQRRELP